MTIIAILLMAGPAPAADVAWTADGVGVRSQPGTANHAVNPEIVADPSGGAIITWADFRSAAQWNIYAQRVDASGRRIWKTDGVGVRSQPGTPDNAFNSRITTDGAGGAIIAWQDHRSGKWDIYAQRIDSGGRLLWTTDGVAVRALPSSAGDANYPRLVPDGRGGAIVTWYDRRSGGKNDIYAQRVDSGGHRVWTNDGVVVRALPGTGGDALYPEIVPDTASGAIIAWRDYRSGGKWDVYAQRVDSQGHARWAADGVGLRNRASSRGDATNQRLSSDGAGGAIVAWQDYRSQGSYDIYAQRVDSNGKPLWAAEGNAVRVEPGAGKYAINPDVSADGAGGAVVAWQDYRSGSRWEIYAQRLDAGGGADWASNGLDVSRHAGRAGDAQNPRISVDGSGAAIMAWRDRRSEDKWDIYAQGVDASGKRLWTTDGIAVRAMDGSKHDAGNLQIAGPGAGGTVATWMDNRSGDKWDVYAQKVSAASSSFYFAEGFTGEGFQEYLCIGNPGTSDASADVTYFFTDGSKKVATCKIARESRSTIDVNQQVGPGREVSIQVWSATPDLVVERPVYFNYQGRWTGGSDAVGACCLSRQWYFAEGTTLAGFDEYVTVLNPGKSTAELTFHYMIEGEGRKDVTGRVGPASRATFKTRDQVGEGKNVSLFLESGAGVVAERPMYFEYSGLASNHWTGGHDVVGTTSPSENWYLAEGTTRAGFEEWLCLQNPGPETITVNATYQLGPGQGGPVRKSYAVPASQRVTVSVNREIGAEKDCSVSLAAGSDFIAERSMYFLYHGAWDGGHDVVAAKTPATSWFFAEGYTGSGFDEWLCLQNPGSEAADAVISYYPEAGSVIEKSCKVPAGSRVTVNVNREAGPGLALSAGVISDRPIIVERPMYFDFRSWTGGHDVVGF
jgi:hypothetical protein